MRRLLQNPANNASGHAVKHPQSPFLHWLISLGALGLFSLAIVDSSIIPLPIPGSTDLLLILLAARHGTTFLTNWIFLAACATAGSILGGFLTWRLGVRGGDAALHRYIPERYLSRVCDWTRRHSFLAIALPAMMPPPIPTSPFALAAGALRVPRNNFFFAYGIGRAIRYTAFAWLGATYGRTVTRAFRHWAANASHFSIYMYSGLIALAIGGGILAWRKKHPAKPSSSISDPQTAEAP